MCVLVSLFVFECSECVLSIFCVEFEFGLSILNCVVVVFLFVVCLCCFCFFLYYFFLFLICIPVVCFTVVVSGCSNVLLFIFSDFVSF